MGTIQLNFSKAGDWDSISLKFNTGGMAESYEEAIEESIKLKNLDTYKEGKYELGAETTYGPLTYQAYHTSTEYGVGDYLVSFLNFKGNAMTVELGDSADLIADPLTTSMLESITLK